MILVDEYDKPIPDLLESTERATANGDYLRGFYGVIKGCAWHVRFVFVTGISMFSKAGLFSELNCLEDISLYPEYGFICGYADAPSMRCLCWTESSCAGGSTATAGTRSAAGRFTILSTFCRCSVDESSSLIDTEPVRLDFCTI